MFTDADAAALYDAQYPWDPDARRDAGFYNPLVLAAWDVLDVGCGTGSLLIRARENGHTGRLTGLDPDEAMLDRARRRSDVEWVAGVAADAEWDQEFDLATMTGNAFQCLVDDSVVRASLTSIKTALRVGGRFAFECRHVRARAWERWNPENVKNVVAKDGRALRVWHEVESIVDDVVTFTETTADADGDVLRVDRSSLRFWDPSTLNGLLTGAGFEIESQYGDWVGGPVTEASALILTIVRAWQLPQ